MHSYTQKMCRYQWVMLTFVTQYCPHMIGVINTAKFQIFFNKEIEFQNLSIAHKKCCARCRFLFWYEQIHFFYEREFISNKTIHFNDSENLMILNKYLHSERESSGWFCHLAQHIK